MNSKEVTELADRIYDIRDRQIDYLELSKFKKIGHSILMMFGVKTSVISAEENIIASLPNAIDFMESGTGIREIVINAASDELITELLELTQ